jgi:elongation factor 1 alpha-like protein
MPRNYLQETVDWDEDGYDEYDDGAQGNGGMSEEDQMRMKQGVAQVKKALGSKGSDALTDKTIEEALWYYYYDVDKSVEYLTKKFISSPQPKAPTKPARKPVPETGKLTSIFSPYFNCICAAGSSEGGGSCTDAVECCGLHQQAGHTWEHRLIHRQDYSLPCPPSTMEETRRFGTDRYPIPPFGAVPEARKGDLIAPSRPKGGLLGGTSAPAKLSKLQALAAARKKKNEEDKGAEKVQVQSAEEKLSKMALTQQRASKKENERPRVESASKRQKFSEPAVASSTQRESLRTVDAGEAEPAAQPTAVNEVISAEERPSLEVLAQPSAFAQAILGHAETGLHQESGPAVFVPPLSWPANLPDPFAEPSPDDVVLAAQSKGALSQSK